MPQELIGVLQGIVCIVVEPDAFVVETQAEACRKSFGSKEVVEGGLVEDACCQDWATEVCGEECAICCGSPVESL